MALAAAPALAEPPGRVVSMNVCTDQLAMLVAAPDQLVSVSFLAHDAPLSLMAEEARAIPRNHGLAEEVFLLRPDLVIVGRYTTRATVAMMERLGMRVEPFDPATSLDDITANLRRMGQILGQPARAEALIAAFDRRLAALGGRAPDGAGQRAATVSLNSFTAGIGSLADAAITASGLTNIGAERGIMGGGRLPLEVLVLEDPDLLILGQRFADRRWLATEATRHPALAELARGRDLVRIDDRGWICGTPEIAAAIATLSDVARRLDAPR